MSLQLKQAYWEKLVVHFTDVVFATDLACCVRSPSSSYEVPSGFFVFIVFETECSAAECTHSFGTAEERSKSDKCWDEVPKMTYWGVYEKIHSHYLFVVTPQQWVPTPIKLDLLMSFAFLRRVR